MIKGLVVVEGNAAHNATHERGVDLKLRAVAGATSAKWAVVSVLNSRELKSLCRTPLTPKEFLRPNSFKASTDVRSAAVLWAARALGPLNEGLKAPFAVRGLKSGDHETR